MSRSRFILERLSYARRRKLPRRDPRQEWRDSSSRSENANQYTIRRDPRKERELRRGGGASPVQQKGSTGGETKAISRDVHMHRVVAPSSYIFAVFEPSDDRQSAADVSIIAAARTLAHKDEAVCALAFGQCAGLGQAGADRVMTLSNSEVESDKTAELIAEIMVSKPVRACIFQDTVWGRHTARFIAARLSVTAILGAHKISQDAVVRRSYGDTRDAVYANPTVLTVKRGSVPNSMNCDYEAAPLDWEFSAAASHDNVECLGQVKIPADEIALEESAHIFSAGAGVSNWTAFNTAAHLLNVARGCSRVVSDRGILPRDRQIGASGRTVGPKTYVAFGISGAIQHLQGIEARTKVIAVNVDPHAPIFKRADLGFVGDANTVLTEIVSKLQAST